MWIVRSWFQSPLSGQICLNFASKGFEHIYVKVPFQSPLSGQICLNSTAEEVLAFLKDRFNPLYRVKFV